MKKINIIILTLIFAALVSACGINQTESGKIDGVEIVKMDEIPAQQEKETSPYELLLNNIYNSLQNDYTEEEISDVLGIGICEVVAGKTTKERMESVAYCIKDINGDDVEELLILDAIYPEPGNIRILDMYTLIGGNPIKVMEGWARNRYYLLNDGMIYCSSSSGAAYSNEALLSFEAESDKLTPGELYFTYPTSEEMDDCAYYYSSDGVYDVAAATEVSSNEFRAFRNRCEQKIVVLDAKTFDMLK